MSAEAALIAALAADSGVSALAGTRVFLKGARQGAEYPYLTVLRVTTPSAVDLDGQSDLDWPLMQIEAWAETGPAAMALANAVRTALQTGELTAAGLTFSATFRDQRGPAADEETRKFRADVDFSIVHAR